MHGFLAQAFTILLPFGAGDSLHPIVKKGSDRRNCVATVSVGDNGRVHRFCM